MSTTTKTHTDEPAKGAGPDEIEEHIEQTRDELGRTVEALSHKLDVKSRTRNTMAAARQRAGSMATRMKSVAMRPMTLMLAGGTAAAAAVAGFMAWKRRH